MQYQTSAADRAPSPASYPTEPRYLGYREADEDKPHAQFFTPTVAAVQPHVPEALAVGRHPAEQGYTVDEAARRMSRPGYEPMETGYTALDDGAVLVSVLTDMPDVTGEMWDWWFGWHSTETSRYKLWHPEAHYYTAVGEDRSSKPDLTDRQRYLDNVAYVDEYLGHQRSPLAIRFLDPTKVGFDQPTPGSTVIAARVGFSTLPIAFGWLVHQVRATESGSEMRSRFFLNDLQVLDLPTTSITSRGGRILTGARGRAAEPLVKWRGGVTADDLGPRLLMHCAQEMNHLAHFLPQLCEAFRDTP